MRDHGATVVATADPELGSLMEEQGIPPEAATCHVAFIEGYVVAGHVPAEAIAELNRKGYRVLVITNQGCVGRGELQPAGLEAIHEKMLDEVAHAGGHIDEIYVCPHIDEDGCDCRKPKPGLINRARSDYDFDPAVTWFIGDTARDVGAAKNAGCRPGLIRSGQHGAGDFDDNLSVFDDLSHFAQELEARQAFS